MDGKAIYSECPDIFPLALDGDKENIKWVLTCAGTSYFVGILTKGEDGVYRFKAEQEKLYCNGGSPTQSVYATHSFYNDAKGRRISLCWMPDKSSPHLYYDKEWNSQMTLPYDTTLSEINGKMILVQTPVEEVYDLFGEAVFTADGGNKNTLAIPSVDSNAYYLEAVLDMTNAEMGGFDVRVGEAEKTSVYYTKETGLLTMDTSKSGELADKTDYKFTGSVYTMPMDVAEDGTITLKIFVDTISVEVFGGKGEAPISSTVFPGVNSNGINIIGDAEIVSLEIREAK